MDGTITCDVDHFTQPNGLTFSPDESLLYIDDSHERIIRRYAVQEDGTLTGGDLVVDMRDDPRPGGPDGMTGDEEGRLWTTGAGGIWVIAPDGTRLGVLELPETGANLCFGRSGFSTLYVTARTSVYQILTMVLGFAPGSRQWSVGSDQR